MATDPAAGGDVTETQWTAVDRYITDHLVPSDAALEAALASSAASEGTR